MLVHGRLWLQSLCGATLLLWQNLGVSQPNLGLFDVYQQNREQAVANLITPDLLMVSYSLIRQRTVLEQERELLIPHFQSFTEQLYQQLSKTKLKTNAQKKAYAYVAVIYSLLTNQSPKPIKGLEIINNEWDLVQQKSGINDSAILNIKIDYSQLQARGRYSQQEELTRYFQAFKYASMAHFFTNSSAATGISAEQAQELTNIAQYLTETIAKNTSIKTAYDQFYQAMTWQYGTYSELNYQDFLKIQQANPTAWTEPQQLNTAINLYRSQQQPITIYDYPVDPSKLNNQENMTQVLTGWRLFSPTQNNDVAAYQQLLYPHTGVFTAPCGQLHCVQPWTLATVNGQQVKAYAKASELLAILGINNADQQIQQNGEHLFKNYAQQQQQASKLLQQPNGLNQLQLQFLQEAGRSYPQVSSLLGFWTWQRYINLLYSKQSMTMGSKSLQIPNDELRKGAMLYGHVDVYKALLKLVNQHQQQSPHLWDDFALLLERLVKIAEQPSLDANDEQLLNDLDKQLLALTGQKDKPIIVDVHTNPIDKMVVEEAIGLPRVIEQQQARGALWQHYEFKQPINQRLDNQQWQTQLLTESL
ncbi:MAG TPA: DUF3160 domain-containing protein [Agitococcus sp.]|nr:DUF3160 domain-containing protein [Agitococcus sp.]